jgi:hypothetical protein
MDGTGGAGTKGVATRGRSVVGTVVVELEEGEGVGSAGESCRGRVKRKSEAWKSSFSRSSTVALARGTTGTSSSSESYLMPLGETKSALSSEKNKGKSTAMKSVSSSLDASLAWNH